MLSPELRLTQAGGSRKHSRPLHRPAYAAEELVLTQEKLNWAQPADKPGAVAAYDTPMFKLLLSG